MEPWVLYALPALLMGRYDLEHLYANVNLVGFVTHIVLLS